MERSVVFPIVEEGDSETLAERPPSEKGSLNGKTIIWVVVNSAATVTIVSLGVQHGTIHDHTQLSLTGLCEQIDTRRPTVSAITALFCRFPLRSHLDNTIPGIVPSA